jgi:hypothetical protein
MRRYPKRETAFPNPVRPIMRLSQDAKNSLLILISGLPDSHNDELFCKGNNFFAWVAILLP